MKVIAIIILLTFSQNYLAAQITEVKYYHPSPLDMGNTQPGQAAFYTLRFSRDNSVFVLQAAEKQTYFDEDNLEVRMKFGNSEMWFYKDYVTHQILSKQSGIRKLYYSIRDTLHPMTWQLTREKKRIEKYQCIKAICRFRGRTYTAWFTPQIPVSNGPWKMGGLPGLILELFDESKQVVFLFYSLNTLPENALSLPEYKSAEELISPVEFYDICKKEFEEFWGFIEGKARKINPSIEVTINEYEPWEIFQK